LDVVAVEAELVAEGSDVAADGFDCHAVAGGVDGIRDAASREHVIRSGGQEFQNPIFDRSQANDPPANFRAIGPRIDCLIDSFNVAAPLGLALDIANVFDEDVARFR
jgi:hypothetical protein